MNTFEQILKLLNKHQYTVNIYAYKDTCGCKVKYPQYYNIDPCNVEYYPHYPNGLTIIDYNKQEHVLEMPPYAIGPFINFHIIQQCITRRYNISYIQYYNDNKLVSDIDDYFIDPNATAASLKLQSTLSGLLLKRFLTPEEPIDIPQEISEGYEIVTNTLGI